MFQYLHDLLGVFRELHRPFENLKVIREIPYEEVWLNYDHLLKYEERKQPYFHPELDKEIPVSAVLDGYVQADERGKIGEQLDRMEKILGIVAGDTSYLIELGKNQLVILQQLNDDENTREALFATIQKGIDEISRKLPANDPLLQIAKKFKTEPDVKTKIKLALNLIFFAVETEVSWDMKEVFRQIVQDMKNGHIFIKP